MDFCIISPTAGLERYAKLSKTHLVLAHVYRDNHRYRSFYNRCRADKDFIILDNGSYENRTIEVVPHDYPNLRPDVVVLPDYLLQPWKKSWHAAIAHLDKWYDCSPHVKWLYIPQAVPGDFHGFIESYQEALEEPRISWIGIPRALAYAITNNPMARVEFARLVKQDRPDWRIHAFGMVNGDTHELAHLRAAGVTSIDSSAPVWRGWNGFDINDKAWNGKPVDFSAERFFYYNNKPYDADSNLNPLAKNDSLIMHNLEVCGICTTTNR